MTRKEKINLINHLKYNRDIGADYLITDKDADEIIKALEHDTPMKVKVEEWIDTRCPNPDCKCELSTHHGDGYYTIDLKPDFCPVCGQALLWDESEEELEEEIKLIELIQTEDCMHRQSAQNKIKEIFNKYDLSYEDGERKISTGGSAYALGHASDDLPLVTPQPKTGWWIEERNDYGELINWHCSNCYEDSGFITTCKWDYCPECGARMVESEDE